MVSELECCAQVCQSWGDPGTLIKPNMWNPVENGRSQGPIEGTCLIPGQTSDLMSTWRLQGVVEGL